jgi:hypothetical protein
MIISCKSFHLKIPKFLFITLIIAAALYSYSCSEQQQDSPKSTGEISFNIDTTTLGDKIRLDKIGVEYHPPKNWELISGSFRDAMSTVDASISSDEQKIFFDPINFHFDSTTKSLLSVGSFEAPGEASDFNSNIIFYEGLLYEKYDSSQIRKGEFVKDNIAVTQYLIQVPEQVIFKLLFENGKGKFVEFDYVTQKSAYSGELKSIESSIGSIILTNHQ